MRNITDEKQRKDFIWQQCLMFENLMNLGENLNQASTVSVCLQF